MTGAAADSVRETVVATGSLLEVAEDDALEQCDDAAPGGEYIRLTVLWGHGNAVRRSVEDPDRWLQIRLPATALVVWPEIELSPSEPRDLADLDVVPVFPREGPPPDGVQHEVVTVTALDVG